MPAVAAGAGAASLETRQPLRQGAKLGRLPAALWSLVATLLLPSLCCQPGAWQALAGPALVWRMWAFTQQRLDSSAEAEVKRLRREGKTVSWMQLPCSPVGMPVGHCLPGDSLAHHPTLPVAFYWIAAGRNYEDAAQPVSAHEGALP